MHVRGTLSLVGTMPDACHPDAGMLRIREDGLSASNTAITDFVIVDVNPGKEVLLGDVTILPGSTLQKCGEGMLRCSDALIPEPTDTGLAQRTRFEHADRESPRNAATVPQQAPRTLLLKSTLAPLSVSRFSIIDGGATSGSLIAELSGEGDGQVATSFVDIPVEKSLRVSGETRITGTGSYLKKEGGGLLSTGSLVFPAGFLAVFEQGEGVLDVDGATTITGGRISVSPSSSASVFGSVEVRRGELELKHDVAVKDGLTISGSDSTIRFMEGAHTLRIGAIEVRGAHFGDRVFNPDFSSTESRIVTR